MLFHVIFSIEVALLVLCTSVFHICEAFQATHRSQPYFGRPLSTFKQRQLRVSATAATSIASSLPPSSPLLPTQTAGRILIVTESAVKSTTIRNLLQLLPAAFQSHYQFVVQTCPQNVTTLTPIKKSVRSTVKDVSEMDFTVAVDSLLYPAYEIVQSKSAIETVGEIQQTLGNISQILLAFDMDRRGEHLSWQLLSVLHVPQNVTLSRLKLTELTPSNFQSCLTNALSPPRNHRSDYEKQLLDMNIVESQLTEQVVDRTISFALSQALYKCQGGYHKLGRLPCAILNLIAKVSERILALLLPLLTIGIMVAVNTNSTVYTYTALSIKHIYGMWLICCVFLIHPERKRTGSHQTHPCCLHS